MHTKGRTAHCVGIQKIPEQGRQRGQLGVVGLVTADDGTRPIERRAGVVKGTGRPNEAGQAEPGYARQDAASASVAKLPAGQLEEELLQTGRRYLQMHGLS